MIIEAKTFRELTAPGYFNFSPTQKPKTKQMAAWFDAFYKLIVDQINLYDDIYRLWATRDYSQVTVSRTPYILYLLKQYGIEWFTGTETQAAHLISIVSGGWSDNAVENFQYLLATLALSPFFWFVGDPQIIFGLQVPAIASETFVIYSNSVSPPATPSNTTYVERAWPAHGGWTLFPSSSTYMSRGYLFGPDIVWTTPLLTTTDVKFFQVVDLFSMPPAPNIGDITIVADDTTGDTNAVYFWDGALWRKNSSLYSNQGSVDDGVPSTPPQRVVAAPNTTVSSEIKPPVSGPSKGYGIYGGLAGQNITSNIIFLAVILTADGVKNLGIIINLLRRIKPTVNKLFLNYTIENVDNSFTSLEIFDSGALI